jgi:hypothetical protein
MAHLSSTTDLSENPNSLPPHVWVHRQRVDHVGPPVPAGVAVAQYLLRDLVAVVADQNGAEGDTNRFSLLGP